MKENMIAEQEVLPNEPSKLKLFLDKNPLPRVDKKTIVAIALHFALQKHEKDNELEDNQ